ncbi:E3 ubiquitin-protein ligase TOM1-like protein [Elsinoe fawcettii]|nr:E3 ubiquitin-protein ligase TOM1-like protein [Elsinoe fawcettii]
MGRIKKQAKEGHDATLSPYVAKFISQCIEVPLHKLSAHLASFPKQWDFPKSDLHSWIPVLDRLDHVLELVVAEYGLRDGPQTKPFRNHVMLKGDTEGSGPRSEDTLQEHGIAFDGDCILAKDVLEFSAFLLDHSSNRGLYSSQDHVNHLLNTTSLSLLKSVLKLCLPLAVRFYANKNRYTNTTASHHVMLHSYYNINQDRLHKIASSFAKRTTPSSHYDAIAGKGKQKDLEASHNPNDISFFLKSKDLPEGIRQSLGDINISYYDRSAVAAPAQRNESLASPGSPTPVRKSSGLVPSTKVENEESSSSRQEPSSGPKTFQISGQEVTNSSTEDVLQENMEKLPAEHKYDLLQQLRVAQGFRGSRQDLLDLISCRILAVANLAYTYQDSNFTQRIGQPDSEQPKDFQLVYQLADLLQPVNGDAHPIPKEIITYAVNALEALVKLKSKCTDVSAALNVSVSHGVLFYAFRQVIASLEANVDTNEEREWRHSIITLVHGLAQPPTSYHRNSDQMVAAGVIGLWVQALTLRTNEAQAFYSDIIHFLDNFVNNGVRDSFNSLVNSQGLEAIAGMTADMVDASLAEVEAGRGMPAEFKTKVTDYEVPFFKQQALRQVLKFILHMFTLNVGSDRHLRNLIDTPQLLGALKRMIANPKIFGSNIWISAVSIVSSFIHSEPTSYNIVHEAGLVAGILDALAPQGGSGTPDPDAILPVGETLRDIPNAFGAICLNEAGMKLFRSSEALNTFLGIFISLDHVKAMEDDGDCAVSIGTAFDELVRHHPDLKDQVHTAVLRMIKMVVTYCRERAEKRGVGAKLWISGLDGKPLIAGGWSALAGPNFSAPMDAAADPGEVTEAEIESDTLNAAGKTTGRYTSDVISVVSKFLQGYLSNNNGGLVALLDLATCPCNPWNFQDLSTYEEVTRVFMQIQESKPHLLLPLLISKTKEVLHFLRPLMDHQRGAAYFEPLTKIDSGSPLSAEAIKIRNSGTHMVKGLATAQTLLSLVSDIFIAQAYYGQRAAQHSYFTQINLTDLYVQIVDMLGRLHSACICELIHLQNAMPEDWKQHTKVKGQSYDNAQADNVMGQVTVPSTKDTAEQAASDGKDEQKRQEIVEKYPAAFRNNDILRQLLSWIPNATTGFLQQLGKSLYTKSRGIMDGWQRQNATTVAERIAAVFVQLLDSPFPAEDGQNLQRYQIVTLTTMLKTYIDKRASYRSNQAELLVAVLNQFYLQGGFAKLNAWALACFEYVKTSKAEEGNDPESRRAYSVASLGVTLEFYSKIVSSKILEGSPQGSSLTAHTNDPSYAGYFEPAQLLIELRDAVYPVVKEIWSPEDGDNAMHLETEDMRSVINTLKHILQADGENKVRHSGRARTQPQRRKWKPKNAESVQNLVNSGIPRDLALEGLYRCNDSMHNAREYCAMRQNEEIEAVDRLPPPEDELEESPPPSQDPSRQQSQSGEASSAALARVPSVEMQDADEQSQTRTDNDDIMSDDDPTTSMFNGNALLNTLANRTSDTLNIDSDNGTEVRSSVSELPSHQRTTSDSEKANAVTAEDLDKKRKVLRENLVDRCIDVLNELSNVTFDIAELIQAATSTSRPESKELKESIGETLALSLVSLSTDETPQRNKRIAAVSHLLALVLQERDFFETTIDILKANFDDFVGLLKVSPASNFEESTPYLSNVLLVMERILIEDEQPAQIQWQPPTSDAPQELTPLDLPPPVIGMDSKQALFSSILDLLPRIGKNELFALSVIRVLVMLTRRRQIAKRLSERPNIGRLFLMVKQLAGLANDKLQGGFLTIIRHMVEDEDVIRQIMRTEIQNFFEMNRNSRSIDTSSYARHLYHLVLRDPDMFVEVSAEKVELNRWDSHSRNSQTLSLKRKVEEPKPKEQPTETAMPSTEQSATEQRPQLERVKTSDMKPPAVENPDGVIQFILKELSSYRDVEDKETTASAQTAVPERSDTPDIEMPDTTPPPDLPPNTRLPLPQPKSERTIFKTEEHPIFTYRCILLQCLTELLSCYNRTKVEFISYSPKTESSATTPSKPRSGLLNYMLTTLVPVGTLQHQDDTSHRKKVATSNWAISTIVALCAKTHEHATSNRSSTDRSLEDEQELVYVRKFVLEQVLKAFNSAMHSTESLDMRYSRFLALSDIINKMLTSKPSSPNIQLNNEVVAASMKNVGKLLYEKGFVSALTAAVAEIDLNFPSAKRAIKYILRPLKWLTETAVQLSLTTDLLGPGNSEEDDLSTSTSVTSDDSDERDATPDIFRNSTLGQFEPGRDESESSEDEDEDDYYGEEYDEDEMDYEDERPVAAHGDVVSDDDEDVDGMGPIEGMPGDVNMDMEIVMDGESGGDSEDDDSEDDDEDDDDEDDDDEDEDGDIEVIDDEINGDRENDSNPEGMEEDEGDWEDDDDGEQYDEEEEMEHEMFTRGGPLDALARVMGDDDRSDIMDRLQNVGVTVDRMDPEYFDDEMPPEDEEDEMEDYDEEVVYEPEPEFDEEEDDDEDDIPQLGATWQADPSRFFRHHHHHHARIPPDPWGSRDAPFEAYTSMRSHRAGMTGRGQDDGSNPLLHRNDSRSIPGPGRSADQPFSETLFAEYGIPRGPGRHGMGRPGEIPNFLADLLHLVGPPGGRVEFFPDRNGGFQSFQPLVISAGPGGLALPHLRHSRPGALSNMLRGQQHPEGTLPLRPPTHDPGQAVSFMPALTVARWQDEARLLFGSAHQTEAVKVTNSVLRMLTPAAVEAKRKRDKEEAERKAAQEKALEEQRKKEEQERKEREEKERQEREEREKKEAEEAAERAREAAETGEESASAAMEGIEESQAEAQQPAEPAEPVERRTAVVRGSVVDITELGIDQSFLDEIPEDMREDVIMAQLQSRLEQRPAEPVPEEIDRDFLSALPAEIQQELLRAEATERSRRDRDEARRRANASGETRPAQPEEMNNADFIAMLDPALRQSVLMEADDEMLSGLPANIRAEAEALFGHSRRGMPRIQDLIEGRRTELSRSGPPAAPAEQRARRPVVQILDKAGVATLLRLMFVALTGTARSAMLGILSDICKNTQNRAEVISILLSILQDGSSDSAALDKSFTQLTTRAKQMSGPKTPQPLRRTLTGQQVSPLNNETSPLMIVQQCLSALTNLAHENARVSTFFLTEHEMISTQRSKTPKKGKSKESKAQRYPINALLTLLDRRTIIENASVMEHLASLLVKITEPLKTYARRAKEDEKKADQTGQTSTQAIEGAATASTDVAMGEGNQTDRPAAEATAVSETAAGEDTTKKEDPKPEEKKKPRDAPPPEIPEENLCLVVNIIAARECSGKTFQNTLDIVNHLSAIPGARDIFGKELVRRASELGAEVLGDLQKLPDQIRNAESNTEMQGRALAVFSPASSHQNKLLRVLLALDYIFDPKRTTERGSTVTAENLPQKARDDLVSSLYDDATFVKLWDILSDCLTAIRERGNMNNVATILQPLIEAFMVVCKNTTAKEVSLVSPKDFASPPPESRIESQFFRFTEEHRKILNDLVRHNPKLMSGTFDVLVKNSKVLEFDNKRNFFNKRLHTRSSEERFPHQTLQLNVRRSEVFLDSFKSLFFKKPNEIKYGKLNIRFAGEEGVDAGGVTREWFAAMSRQMFNPNYALFNPVAADRTTFHPNPLSVINEQHLTFFKFIGRIIGKALYENRVLDCHFSRAVYKRILGKSVSLKDMETLDLDYYKSLMWMLENDITDVAFETFSVEVDRFGETETVDLKPDGRNIPVTEENKHEYVKLVVEQRLTKSVEEQLEHFLIGFREIVPLELISIFNEQELELLISGLPDIDVDDWKNNTEYHNYTQTSPQVQWFWRAVRSFDAEEKAKLLQFVTGTSKVPLNGFKELEGMNGFSRFNIHRDFGSKDRLPSSHTCFNQLDLPEYESYEALRKQLYTAMTVGSDHFGFA